MLHLKIECYSLIYIYPLAILQSLANNDDDDDDDDDDGGDDDDDDNSW